MTSRLRLTSKQRKRKWTLENSSFGAYVAIESPNECDAIVICADTMQHEPISISLPHQAYRKNLIEIMNAKQCDEITIMPYRNSDKVTIKRSDLLKARVRK